MSPFAAPKSIHRILRGLRPIVPPGSQPAGDAAVDVEATATVSKNDDEGASLVEQVRDWVMADAHVAYQYIS